MAKLFFMQKFNRDYHTISPLLPVYIAPDEIFDHFLEEQKSLQALMPWDVVRSLDEDPFWRIERYKELLDVQYPHGKPANIGFHLFDAELRDLNKSIRSKDMEAYVKNFPVTAWCSAHRNKQFLPLLIRGGYYQWMDDPVFTDFEKMCLCPVAKSWEMIDRLMSAQVRTAENYTLIQQWLLKCYNQKMVDWLTSHGITLCESLERKIAARVK